MDDKYLKCLMQICNSNVSITVSKEVLTLLNSIPELKVRYKIWNNEFHISSLKIKNA